MSEKEILEQLQNMLDDTLEDAFEASLQRLDEIDESTRAKTPDPAEPESSAQPGRSADAFPGTAPAQGYPSPRPQRGRVQEGENLLKKSGK